jgi:hypothetical protein
MHEGRFLSFTLHNDYFYGIIRLLANFGSYILTKSDDVAHRTGICQVSCRVIPKNDYEVDNRFAIDIEPLHTWF